MIKYDFLKDVIDIHFHTMPDVRQRKYDDFQIANQIKNFGGKGVVIKSHVSSTVARASLVQQVNPDMYIYGGITLNPQVGGINPSAVKAAVAMGAKFVWLPTSFSYNARKQKGFNDGIKVTKDNVLIPEMEEILDMIATADIALGTGHISVEELHIVVKEAVLRGVKKIVINHPEKSNAFVPLKDQEILAQYNEVFFERCYAERSKDGYILNFDKNLEAMKLLGTKNTIIATDGGQVENPDWEDMMGDMIYYYYNNGISLEDIKHMTITNPKKILNIE